MMTYSQRGHTISLRHSVKCCFGVHLYSYLIENGKMSQGFKYPKCELSLQFSTHVFRTPFIIQTHYHIVLRIYRLLQPTENVAWMDRRDVETEFSGKSLKRATFGRYLRHIKVWWGKLKERNQFEAKPCGILNVVDRHGRFGKSVMVACSGLLK